MDRAREGCSVADRRRIVAPKRIPFPSRDKHKEAHLPQCPNHGGRLKRNSHKLRVFAWPFKNKYHLRINRVGLFWGRYTSSHFVNSVLAHARILSRWCLLDTNARASTPSPTLSRAESYAGTTLVVIAFKDKPATNTALHNKETVPYIMISCPCILWSCLAEFRLHWRDSAWAIKHSILHANCTWGHKCNKSPCTAAVIWRTALKYPYYNTREDVFAPAPAQLGHRKPQVYRKAYCKVTLRNHIGLSCKASFGRSACGILSGQRRVRDWTPSLWIGRK